MLHLANSNLSPQIPTIKGPIIEQHLENKIGMFKAKNLDCIWLEKLLQLFKLVLKQFDTFRRLHLMAIETSNGIQFGKRILDVDASRIPKDDIFNIIKTNSEHLYLSTAASMKEIQRFVNDLTKNVMPTINDVNSHPTRIFLTELVLINDVYVKFSMRNRFLTTMESEIKQVEFKEYIQTKSKLLNEKRPADANNYFQIEFDKKFASYDALLSMLQMNVTLTIAYQAEAINEFNDMFNIPREAGWGYTNNYSPFDVKIVSKTIVSLGEKINKLQNTSTKFLASTKQFRELLSHLRTFLWKMFDIYVVISDLHTKCTLLDPFNTAQSANKVKNMLSSFEGLLAGILNSIFKPYEAIIRRIKDISSSSLISIKIKKVLVSSETHATKVTILADDIREKSKEILDTVAPESSSHAAIEAELIAESKQFNSRISKMDKFIKHDWFKFPAQYLISKMSNLTATMKFGGKELEIPSVREKLAFFIKQNNYVYLFFDVIVASYLDTNFELKQLTKNANGLEFKIPPAYIITVLKTDRSRMVNKFKEIRESVKQDEHFRKTIAKKMLQNDIMWRKLNETPFSQSVTKALQDLNQICKDMLFTFIGMLNSEYEYQLMLGQKVIVDMDSVTETPALNYIEANFNFEMIIVPNSRRSFDVVDTMRRNIKDKAKDFKEIQNRIMAEAMAAIENFEGDAAVRAALGFQYR